MDLTLIIGALAGLFLIGLAISEGGNLAGYFSFSSILITVGGTFAATFASFRLKTFLSMGKHILIAIKKPKLNYRYCIDTIVELAQDARKNGILSIEEKAMGLKDKFLSNCVMLVVDAMDPEKTKELIQKEIDSVEMRHASVWKMYEKASSYAPAFGMIGTLIGLINMLANLDMDAEEGSKALTNGMAVALLTTLYGSMIANLVFMPLANKLRERHDEEMLCKMIVAEGVMAIQAGENPRIIEQKLNAFLNSKERMKKEKKSKKNKSSEESEPEGMLAKETNR